MCIRDRYVNCLRNALYEQNCKSVALSGSYGSGKSSILEQFIKEAKEDGHSVAKVSLATFNVDPYRQGAVSYTHLDVYKRQGPARARSPYSMPP